MIMAPLCCILRDSVLLLVGMLVLLSHSGQPISVADVPSFQYSCSVSSTTDNKPNDNGTTAPSQYLFQLGTGMYAKPQMEALANGTEWSEWSEVFNSTNAAAVMSPVWKSMDVVGVQMGLVVRRVDNGTMTVRCRFRFVSTANHTADGGKAAEVVAQVANVYSEARNAQMHQPDWKNALQGAFVGLMLGRDNRTKAPLALTWREYNKLTYWPMLDQLPPPRVPTLFPVVDIFLGDDDIGSTADAFDQLGKLGINTLLGETQALRDPRSPGSTGGGWQVPIKLTTLGNNQGERKDRWNPKPIGQNWAACTSPNSSCSYHDYSTYNATDADLVNASDLAAAARSYFPNPVGPGKVAFVAMADEPGWHAPGTPESGGIATIPVLTSPIVRHRWQSYLKAQGLTPAELGSSSWDDVLPMTRSRAGAGNTTLADDPKLLPQRKLFYWTLRFSTWDSARYMNDWTTALEVASGDPAIPTYVNWHNFDGRFYVPGEGAGYDPNSVDQGASDYDWFEWARMRGGNMLWTEVTCRPFLTAVLVTSVSSRASQGSQLGVCVG